MPTLGLAMIVRDEEETLGRCLESVKGIFDQVVIVDTGSKDRTKEIAKAFGAEIHEFTWIDDFAAARNFAFSKLTTDYLSWLDADDVYLPGDRAKFLSLKTELGSADSYLFRYNYAQDQYGNSICMLYRHRVARRDPGVVWKHPIHECMNLPPGWHHETTEIVVTHKRSAKDAAKDLGRNTRMLRKAVEKDPKDPRLQFYLGKELVNEGKHKEALPVLEAFLKNPDWHENEIQAFHFAALCHLHLKDEKRAIETCLKGIHKDPRWAEFYVLIGEIHYQRGMRGVQGASNEWQVAAQWFEIASKMEQPATWGTVQPENYTWLPHDRLCKCYAEMGQIQRAYDHNEKALTWRPAEARFLGNREYLRDILFDRKSKRPIRLNLGGGGKPVPGYRKADLYPGPGIEFNFDQCELPYRDHTVHAIYSEHALEHAPSHQAARNAIGEWARALRYGGHLKLKVPDLDLCCKGFLEEEDRARKPGEKWTRKEWYRYTIYGIQESQGNEPPEGQYHRTGFTKGELKRLLEANGFDVLRLENYDGWGTPSIEAEAVQLNAPVKIRWLLSNPREEDPSSRIRRLNIHRFLATEKVDSRLDEIYGKGERNPETLLEGLRDADVVVFTQFGEVEKQLADSLNRCGVATVYDMNEDLGDQAPAQKEFLSFMRFVVFCSTAMAKKYGKDVRHAVIPDAYEIRRDLEHSYAPHGKNGKVRVVWCGMGGNAQNCDFLRPIMEELDLEFMTIHEWKNPDRVWKLDTWLYDLADADIAITPQRVELQPCKSNTKATQAMALGLPVVASPLQAYDEAVIEEETGFICKTPAEWRAALERLKDQSLREQMGRAGMAHVAKEYSIQTVAAVWMNLVLRLSKESCDPPVVDIVIPTYNNLEYLEVCIESIRKSTDTPHNIIVVNSGTDGTLEWLKKQPDIIHYHSEKRLQFSAANNVGIKIGKAPYVCLLNDDTIVGHGWLGALLREGVQPRAGAVGPFSNCDQTWLHHEPITVAGRGLHPGMSMGQVKGIIPFLYRHSHPKVVHPQEWIAFYCTLIPRHVLDETGLLDEEYRSGCEDKDFCIEMNKRGYRALQTYDSWVFHFGGRTRKTTHNEDAAKHAADDKWNYEVLEKKHGRSGLKRTFVLYTGPAWEKWSPKNVDGQGIGGSETCAVHVAREFARKGWRSIVFGDCGGNEGDFDGVQYVDHARFSEFVSKESMDFFVSSRKPEPFALPIRAKRTACWVHDIWLARDPNTELHHQKVGKFLVLSPWHRDFFLRHHRGVPPEKVHITRDVVDMTRYQGKIRKAPGRLVYSSSPDRGLDCLLDVLPAIQAEVPDAELHVFYGFHNWETSARTRGDQPMLDRIEALKKRLAEQQGVVFRGRVGQRDLAREQMKAELWAYPTWFTETFCITAAEAMAAGAAVVTTDVAALPTTVGDAGLIIDVPKNQFDCGITEDAGFRERFVRACVTMLSQDALRKEMAERGRQKAVAYGIEGIVEEWLAAVPEETPVRV
jgi:GT2 family glycosyltransferase/predicted SAM-dependent methyltransferase